MNKSKLNIVFFLILAIGIFFRFYNLDWGAPYYFHPDERNIASSISQLSFPTNMNPHFFAYGSIPIYTTYFIGVIQNLVTNLFTINKLNVLRVNFDNAIIIGRSISAFLSVFLLYLIYKTSTLVANKKTAILATSLATLSVGFIQYSHFSTFEMWLSFFSLSLVFTCLLYAKKQELKFLVLISVFLGLLIGIKISSLIFIPFIVLLILFSSLQKMQLSKLKFDDVRKLILKICLLLIISFLILEITNPFIFLDSQSFFSSIRYEASVATGTLPVFYTQEFENTTPIFYQLLHVYPFLLNPFIEIVFLMTLIFLSMRAIKTKNPYLIILLSTFFITFLSQSFLYVKWVRYYVPTLPFIYILVSIGIFNLVKQKPKLKLSIVVFLILISLLFSYSYFNVVLLNKDSRIDASTWANKNIPKNSKMLAEVYDLGIVPFNSSSQTIKLFNFYDLETNPSKIIELKKELATTNYIILPSQRIIQTRLKMKNLFPQGYNFYNNLFNGNLGFKKIYQTRCDLFCNILYLRNPIFAFEQTASVFDHPTVFIFKK